MRTSALFAEHRWTDFQHKIVREPKCLSARSHVLQTSLLSHQKQSTTEPSISLHLGRTLLQLGNSSFPPSFSSLPPPNPHRCESLQMKTRNGRIMYRWWTTLAKEIFTRDRDREARVRVDRITHSSEAWRTRTHGRRERESGKERFQYVGG